MQTTVGEGTQEGHHFFHSGPSKFKVQSKGESLEGTFLNVEMDWSGPGCHTLDPLSYEPEGFKFGPQCPAGPGELGGWDSHTLEEREKEPFSYYPPGLVVLWETT